MVAETGAKDFVKALVKVGVEAIKDGSQDGMFDPKMQQEAMAAMNAMKGDTEAHKMGAKLAVDMMQDSGVNFKTLGAEIPKHGVATTREEFDKLYTGAGGLMGDLAKDVMPMTAKLAETPGAVDFAADMTTHAIKSSIPHVINELKDRGTDPSDYIKAASRSALGPADIDLAKLDPRLTSDERKMVEVSKAMSEKLTDGRLQSNAEDAPTASKWGNRIKAEQAAAQGKANVVG